MEIRSIEWKNNAIKIIDQTKLPGQFEYIYLKNLPQLWRAIKMLKVRGAPALGAAASLGVYLGLKDNRKKTFVEFNREMDKVISYLGSSRPTARNLFWGLERMRNCALKHKDLSVVQIKKKLFQEAKALVEEDRRICRKIGEFGATLIRDNDTILTVCNAGILATIDYGTALGVLYKAKEQGKKIKVYSCETRPLLQGSRLTVWELMQKGVDVTLICDNMAAKLMNEGKINLVIAGADRIAASGDAANKIGTLGLAVLSKYHRIPFYIAAPSSTFDLNLQSGSQITIEQRVASEVTGLLSKQGIAPKGVKVYNPAFDVTPNELISAIITEKGIIKAPYNKNIKKILG